MPSHRPTKYPQAVSTCANHGAVWQRLDQQSSSIRRRSVTERSHDAGAVVTKCGCRKRCRASSRPTAPSSVSLGRGLE